MIIRPPFNQHPFYFPDYIEYALSEFEKRDWTNKSFGDLQDDFRNTFLCLPYFPIRIPKGSVVYRGRKPLLFKDEPFSKLEEIKIKPSSKVETMGRANLPHQAIFYGCTKPETVAREVTQWYINDGGRAQDLISRGIMSGGFNQATQLFTLGRWEVTEDLVLASLLFNETAIANNPVLLEFDQQRKMAINHQSEKVVTSQNMVLDFFCKQFGKVDVSFDEEYKYSAYYAHEVYCMKNPKLDGVIYSSVANNFDGENIAITEDVFIKKLKFLGADFCYSANLSHNPLKDGTNTIVAAIENAELLEDGSFVWRKAPPKSETR